MLPIEKMSFSTTRTPGGDTMIRGGITFGHHVIVSKYEAMGIHGDDIVSDAKKRMRAELWHKTYGDLKDPLRELEHLALVGARYEDEQRVRELVAKIRTLLTLPDQP